MDKYSKLWEFFTGKNDDKIKLSFEEIQNIAWIEIDHSFLTYKKNLEKYWYKVEKISQKESFVIFKKTNQWKIALTSCGIINDEFKERFYKIISKEDLGRSKLLYITTASDGEKADDKSWMDEEYKTILDLWFYEKNLI